MENHMTENKIKKVHLSFTPSSLFPHFPPTFPAFPPSPFLCLIIPTHLFPPPSPPPCLLFDSFFKSLPNSCVPPQRLFVCTSIISGDKRRPCFFLFFFLLTCQPKARHTRSFLPFFFPDGANGRKEDVKFHFSSVC